MNGNLLLAIILHIISFVYVFTYPKKDDKEGLGIIFGPIGIITGIYIIMCVNS